MQLVQLKQLKQLRREKQTKHPKPQRVRPIGCAVPKGEVFWALVSALPLALTDQTFEPRSTNEVEKQKIKTLTGQCTVQLSVVRLASHSYPALQPPAET